MRAAHESSRCSEYKQWWKFRYIFATWHYLEQKCILQFPKRNLLFIVLQRLRLCQRKAFKRACFVPFRPIPEARRPPIMCIQIIERFSVCRCIYYRHAVDPCPARAQRHHGLVKNCTSIETSQTCADTHPCSVQEKTVFVGYACERHVRGRGALHQQRQDLIGSLWKLEL